MAFRQTSIKCYYEIKENGSLSRNRFLVYEALVFSTVEGNPVTAAEIFHYLRVTNQSRNNIAARLTELRQVGVAGEYGTKICPHTNQEVIAWLPVDKMPIKFEKKSTSPKEIIKALEEENAKLRQEIFELRNPLWSDTDRQPDLFDL